MKIYKVKYDDTGGEEIRYQTLYLSKRGFKDDLEIGEYLRKHFKFAGVPIKDWHPPEMRSPYPLHIAPDFWSLDTNTGAFAAGSKAMEIRELNNIFLDAGQLLPLPFKGEELTICNILECVDCIDEEKTEWHLEARTKKRLSPKRPFFVERELPHSSLFKIYQDPRQIYVWERNRDPECEFKACVEANKLTGLKFEPMWSEEEGIIPYKHPEP
jgi:hypothetical protein